MIFNQISSCQINDKQTDNEAGVITLEVSRHPRRRSSFPCTHGCFRRRGHWKSKSIERMYISWILKLTVNDVTNYCIVCNQAFGIDDGRLIWAALLPSFIIFPLYLQWSSQQETDDFFDGYEKRRQG